MKKNTFFLFLTFLSLFTNPETSFAYTAGKSASLAVVEIPYIEDKRVKILEKYLEKHNSPLAPFADDFVEQADKNSLDWKLVVSIAGVESYFGRHIPYESFNGWGWGVYGTNSHSFASWSDGITTISKGLKTRYIDTWGATDVYGIGKFYASDPNWANKVTHFMEDITEFERNYHNTSLSISI